MSGLSRRRSYPRSAPFRRPYPSQTPDTVAEEESPVRCEGDLGDSIEGAETPSGANREGVEEGRLLSYLRVATFEHFKYSEDRDDHPH